MNRNSSRSGAARLRRGLRVFGAASIAGSLLLASAVSPAQSSADPEELLRRAENLLLSKKPLEALLAWRAAWSIKPTYVAACNIGRAELLYGSPREAAEFLEICRRIYPEPKKPSEKARRAGFADDLKKARALVASLHITVNESGAKLQIDERTFGPSPQPDEIFVEPGTHRVRVTKEGFDATETEITVKPGEERALTLTLRKAKPPVKEATPPPLLPLAQRSTLPVTPRGPLKLVVVGGLALAGVQAGVGIGLLIGRAVEQENALELRQDVRVDSFHDCTEESIDVGCADYLASQRSRAAMQTAAVATLIGAGVTVAATAAYTFFPRARKAPVSARGVGIEVSF